MIKIRGFVARLRLLLVSDLHGSSTAFGKLSNVLRFYKADIVVLAGDLTGKAIVPIIRRNGSYSVGKSISKYMLGFLNGKGEFGDGQLNDIIKTIRSRGYYPYITDEAGYEELVNNKDKVKDVFIKLMIEALQEDLGKVEERYRQQGVKLLLMPGNDDYQEIADYVNNKLGSSVLISIDEGIFEFNGYTFVGFGYSTPTPWHTPREIPDGELRDRVSKLVESVDITKRRRLVLVLHDPPYNTTIDQAYQLSSDFKPIIRGGEVLRVHVGSKAVRELIETYSPVLGLHGHIHESPGIDYVRNNSGDKTPVVNAGSEYSDGVLRLAYLILEDGKLKNYFLMRG